MVDREAMLIRRVELEIEIIKYETIGFTAAEAEKQAAIKVDRMIERGEIK